MALALAALHLRTTPRLHSPLPLLRRIQLLHTVLHLPLDLIPFSFLLNPMHLRDIRLSQGFHTVLAPPIDISVVQGISIRGRTYLGFASLGCAALEVAISLQWAVAAAVAVVVVPACLWIVDYVAEFDAGEDLDRDVGLFFFELARLLKWFRDDLLKRTCLRFEDIVVVGEKRIS